VLIHRRLDGIDLASLLSTAVRITIASLVMGAATWSLHFWLTTSGLPGDAFVLRLLQVGLSIGVALVVLAVLAKLLRIEEFDQAFGQILNRLRPRRAPEGPRG
jgi:peptidoglycan biosynthesis protein MviN/MurJ (putative lipid II flippase)